MPCNPGITGPWLKISTMSTTLSSPPPPTPSRFAWLVGLVYLLAFVLLDWASFIRPLQGLNITPWNPQPALAIALLYWNRRWLWMVWAGLLLAELLVRGAPESWIAALTSTTALSLIYAAIAHALAMRMDRALTLGTRSDLIWFTGVAVGGALVGGAVYIAALSLAGIGPSGPILGAITRYWIGNSVGLLVTLPILFVVMDTQRRAALIEMLKSRQWWLISVFTGGLLWAIFAVGGQDQFKFFYLLFLPVVWISARFGIPGAVAVSALAQLGLIIGVQSIPHPDLRVFELQVLMAAITMTGLTLGVTVDERARAEAGLHSSLRLAAAGQMAAALAHELSQPLTALSTYAQACQILVEDARDLPREQRRQLMDVTGRMVNDVNRAGDVIKRLRDFFRTGSTQLAPVDPAQLVQEALQVHQRRALAAGLQLESTLDEDLPQVWMDPVQISIVLRNLIDNAIDSVRTAGPGGFVRIDVRTSGTDLLIEVRDSGPGVDPARMPKLFESGPSDKPGGMGLGLSICRSIVDAHGGRLWAEPGPGGLFRVTLPLEGNTTSGATDAR